MATARKMVIVLSALVATRPTFARRSAWNARLAGVLLASTASLAAAGPAKASVVPFSHEFTRRKLGYVMDNDSIRTAVASASHASRAVLMLSLSMT